MSPYAAINYIRRGIGYDEFCVEYADYRRMNVEDLYEVLEELQNSAKGFDTYNDWFEHIENYTAELERFIDSRIRTRRALHLPHYTVQKA